MPAKGWKAPRPGYQGDIEAHLPLVKFVYARLPHHVKLRLEWDDAYQAGVEGLLLARRLYDPARGQFSTFAWSKIRWAILIAAGLTRQGWERPTAQLSEHLSDAPDEDVA